MDSILKTIKVRLIKILDATFSDEDKKSLSAEELEFTDAVISKYSALNTIDKDKAWAKFEQNVSALQKKTKKSYKIFSSLFLRYAAIFIGVCLSLFYFLRNETETDNMQWTDSIIIEDSIKLTSLDGTIQNLNIYKNDTITNAKGKIVAIKTGKELSYQAFAEKEDYSIQTLEVPNGQTFRIVLSDGTKVYCDAGTTLQFPVTFSKTSERKVKLSGQAYFDVVTDADNPFIVETNNIDIRVLGTQFNVSSYKNNNNIQTTLVEGLVKINQKNKTSVSKTITLLPGQMATYSVKSKRIHTKKVNTYNYTAWMSQKLIFKEVSFSTILKTLERQFNVTIINENVALDEDVYTAKFTNETLEQILKVFQIDNDFTYTLKNNHILIK